ncbi:MAG: hypothetical protein IJ491_09440 [Clostridia bacterium]|nr:hypothetical protein [Clostridia bacterium]
MKRIFKGIAFVLIFAVSFFGVQGVLAGDADTRDYKRINGFFEEKEGSLDAVFLGSSATYSFWSAPMAWAEYGISVYPFSNSAQPLFAAEFMIEDARKTQPDALFIINITHLLRQYDTYLHKLLNNYPLTLNKLRMTDYLCDVAGISFSQRMEYYLPIIRYHDRWNELSLGDFYEPEDEYKTGNSYNSFLTGKADVDELNTNFSSYEELGQENEQSFIRLMDYCERENVKVLFVVVPQGADDERAGKQNTMIKMLEERNFDVLDLRRHIEEIGLDGKTDYYNARHTNLHGSIKFTDYLSRYLIENYGFEDKRGNDTYSDWDEASEKYYSLISGYITQEDSDYITITQP